MKKIHIIIFVLIILVIFLVYYIGILIHKSLYTSPIKMIHKPVQNSINTNGVKIVEIVETSVPKYNGLVLFDIDGTLTTGNDNYNVVKYCLDKGWAVGICTAGSVYNMNNLLSFSWMPENLYNFMRDTGSITFNNVASGILCGRYNPKIYKSLSPKIAPPPMTNPSGFIMGYRKGFALEQTGNVLGITDPKKLVLCDDMIVFIQAVQAYNQNVKVICAGKDCGGKLSLESIIQAISPS